MYRWFLTEQPDLALGATLEGELAGFAVGAVGGYGRRIARYALPEIARGLICHPRCWFDPAMFRLWPSYARGLVVLNRRRHQQRVAPTHLKVSLAMFAVSGSAQGRGIGRALMIAFERAATKRGATLLGLTVEMNNRAARHLYESGGWRALHEDSEGRSAHYFKIPSSKP